MPGNKSLFIVRSSILFIAAYWVVFIFNLLIKSFSKRRFWTIRLIPGFGKTGLILFIIFKVSKGIFSNSNVTKSTQSEKYLIFFSSLYSPKINSSQKFFAGAFLSSEKTNVLIFSFLQRWLIGYPIDPHQEYQAQN